MKKLSIVLGENECCVNMEFEGDMPDKLFKEFYDRMFNSKFGIMEHEKCCHDCGDNISHENVSENISEDTGEDNPTSLSSLVDMAMSTIKDEEGDDASVYLPENKFCIVLLRCDCCGGRFFSRATSGEPVTCRCGREIPTDKTFYMSEYTCKKCQKIFTFYSDKSIQSYSAKCSDCGADIKLKFDEARHSLNNY